MTKPQAAPIEPAADQTPMSPLEVPTPVIRSIMGVWGTQTETTIRQLQSIAPGWASWLQEVYTLVDDTLSAQS